MKFQTKEESLIPEEFAEKRLEYKTLAKEIDLYQRNKFKDW